MMYQILISLLLTTAIGAPLKTIGEELAAYPAFDGQLKLAKPRIYANLSNANTSSCPCNVFDDTTTSEIASLNATSNNCIETHKDNSTAKDECLTEKVCTPLKTLGENPCMGHFNSTSGSSTLNNLVSECDTLKVTIAFNSKCKANDIDDWTILVSDYSALADYGYSILQAVAAVSKLKASQVTDSQLYKDHKGQSVNQRVQLLANNGTLRVTINFGTQATATANKTITCSNGFIHVMDKQLSPPKSASQTLKDANLTTLAGAVGTTLDDFIGTVFAPNNGGFNNFPVFSSLSQAGQSATLNTHLVAGKAAFAADLSNGQNLTAASNATLHVHINGTSVNISAGSSSLDYGRVILTDVITDAGVVHVLDAVLRPEADESLNLVDQVLLRPELSTLATVLLNKNYSDVKTAVENCKECTLFAPNNDAFNKTNITQDVKGLLEYHAIGEKKLSKDLKLFNRFQSLLDKKFVNLNGTAQDLLVLVNNETKNVTVQYGFPSKHEVATVVTADVGAANGVVHVIDTVLNYPVSTTSTVQRGGFKAMYELANSTHGLLHQLDGVKNGNQSGFVGYTLFVAADKRYDDQDLALNSTETTKVLLNQVFLEGRLFSEDLGKFPVNSTNKTIVSHGGTNYTVMFDKKGHLTVGGHKVLEANILTSNGVVHVLDGVLGLENKSSSGLTTGVLAAIIVGGLALLLLVCYCLAKACKDDGTAEERQHFARLADPE